MNDADRDLLIAKHVDAIRAIIRPHAVLALLLVDDQARPYFTCIEENVPALMSVVSGLGGLSLEPPTSP